MRAQRGLRIAGYLIDLLPALFVGLVGLIPIVGIILAGLVLAPYWLLRDVGGASLGKLVLGMRVTRKDGSPATIGARILRNLPLAVGPALLTIPFAGYVLGPSVATVTLLVEMLLLHVQGDRLGDRLAGTTVMKKSAESALRAAA